MKLVLVHGRSQHGKDPIALRREWTDALEVGFDRAGVRATISEVAFAYYGDLLADLVERVERDLPADIATRGAGSGPPSYALTQRAILADLVAGAGITEEQITAELGDVHARDPQNWGWVLAAVRTLSRIPGLDGRVIDTWLQDVSLYVTNQAVQRAVDQVVASELDATPFVLVAHSLGTVVSYNVLRSPQRTAQCRGLVTLGSPLGISAIRNRLPTPTTYPPDLLSWFNAFDRADIVALRPLDDNFFPTDPPIENHAEVANFTHDRHGIAGYLADSTVATTIARLLR
jgi:pimeloyl-ACP methyl ester carboxylesterase